MNAAARSDDDSSLPRDLIRIVTEWRRCWNLPSADHEHPLDSVHEYLAANASIPRKAELAYADDVARMLLPVFLHKDVRPVVLKGGRTFDGHCAGRLTKKLGKSGKRLLADVRGKG